MMVQLHDTDLLKATALQLWLRSHNGRRHCCILRLYIHSTLGQEQGDRTDTTTICTTSTRHILLLLGLNYERSSGIFSVSLATTARFIDDFLDFRGVVTARAVRVVYLRCCQKMILTSHIYVLFFEDKSSCALVLTQCMRGTNRSTRRFFRCNSIIVLVLMGVAGLVLLLVLLLFGATLALRLPDLGCA